MSESEDSTGAADARWVSIYTCRSREEAHLAVAKLRHHGIDARTDGEEMAVAGVSIFSGAGSVTLLDAKVQVLEPDAPAALAVLKEVDRRRVERLGNLPCPKCNALAPDRAWPVPRLVAIALFVSGIALLCAAVAPGVSIVLALAGTSGLFWPWTPRWRCTACGHRWIAPDPDSQVEDEDEEEDEDDENDAGDQDAEAGEEKPTA